VINIENTRNWDIAQLLQMLDNHIIEESSNLWMAPAVFVKKKSGELHGL